MTSDNTNVHQTVGGSFQRDIMWYLPLWCQL